MKVLEVKNLTKKFKDFTAVDDISFDMEEGEILGILGVNGAGKTTTIQMLLSALTPSSGEIVYFGKSLEKNRSEILEQVNFSSTYTNLPLDLTVKENLTFISYLYKIKDRKKRVREIAEIFQLNDLMDEKVTDLSSGQQTRVNLAKSFINFPKILLLDEPTASLDPEIARYIRNLLLEERKNFKVSIIITSHNMQEVEEICDRVIFINAGKIIADDKPENLARSIKSNRLRLLIKEDPALALEYCKKSKLNCEIEGNCLLITLAEDKIPELLKNLVENKIYYNEINIDKPNLEDYFLRTINKNNGTT